MHLHSNPNEFDVHISACKGQLCGIFDSTTSSQGIAVFNNSHFPMNYISCEDAFTMTNNPPNSSQLITILNPNDAIDQQFQVGHYD